MLRRCTVVLVAAFPLAYCLGQQPAGQPAIPPAQQPAAENKPVAVPGQSVSSTPKLSDADLEELMAPIALYPDPLLANFLAASVYPTEVAKAANYVKTKGDPAKIDTFDWEPPVKAIAKIPDAIKMMGEYPDWTAAVGQAYILQAQDVMKAVQNLRARAQANGALTTTPQQTVTTQGDTIIIQPSQPDVIYVPTYNPSVVYVDHYDSGDVAAAGIIGFGLGVAAGAIIANNMDCCWHGGYVGWGGGWGGHNDVDIDINRNTNINNIGNNNNIGGRPGQEGGAWTPNSSKAQAGRTDAMNKYRGAGQPGTTAARAPGRQGSSAPIASRPAPRPSTQPAAANRPATSAARAPAKPAATPANRPSSPSAASRPATPASRPSIPASRPPAAAPRPSTPQSRPTPTSSSRPSAYGGGGGSGAAASRGSASRSSASRSGGGGSRGGGGGRGGGGRR